MKLKTIFILLGIGLILLFSIQNAQITEVRFLIWKLSMSRVLIIVGSFIIGIMTGLLIAWTAKSK